MSRLVINTMKIAIWKTWTFQQFLEKICNKKCSYIVIQHVCMSETMFSLYIAAHGAVVKDPPANAGDARDVGTVSGLRRSPGVGNINPF